MFAAIKNLLNVRSYNAITSIIQIHTNINPRIDIPPRIPQP